MPADATPWFLRHPRWTLALVALAGIVLVVGVLVAVEAGLRRADRKPQAVPPPERVMRFRESPLDADLLLRPEAAMLADADGLEDVPVRFQTDGDGFILPARRHASADLTVLFLGGSTTACLFVPDSLRFHALTATRLEAQTGRRVDALNAARTGNHVLHSQALLLGKGVPQTPDVVVVMHAVNDLTTLLRAGDYWNDNPSRGLLIDDPCQTPGCHLRLGLRGLGGALFPALGRRLRPQAARVSEFDGPVVAPDTAFVQARFRSALVGVVESARAWGITPVLMTQANRFTPEPQPTLAFPHDDLGLSYAAYRAQYVAFNAITRSVAADLGVPVVDLDAIVPRDRAHLYDYVHLTAAGSRLVAEALADTLATRALPPSP
ncbi:MAG: hypothetical protein CMM84_10070 [Rhodothermaceae bacterium]|nr:hypothetical protein [Rhodothermaceae bacterium]